MNYVHRVDLADEQFIRVFGDYLRYLLRRASDEDQIRQLLEFCPFPKNQRLYTQFVMEQMRTTTHGLRSLGARYWRSKHDLDSVMKRGNWKSFDSVMRYLKV